jgi:hypothetical protein
MKISKKEQELLILNSESEEFELIGEFDLYLDSHGLIKAYAVIQEKEMGKTFCFYYEYSSEEFFYEDQDLVEVSPYEYTETRWFRVDGEEHQ